MDKMVSYRATVTVTAKIIADTQFSNDHRKYDVVENT